MNFGAGKVVDRDIGLYNTYPYALHRIAMARLWRHPLRTLNRSEATLFFIPYDMGIDIMISNKTGKYKLDKDTIGQCPHASKAIEHLQMETTTRKPNFLNDHVLIFSISHGHPMKGSCRKFFDYCYNCTVLTTNTYEWLQNMTKFTKRPWYSIPYASAWHYSNDIRFFPWENNDSIKKKYLITNNYLKH
jgi:hypothetical protein